jgi:hypothetical protein
MEKANEKPKIKIKNLIPLVLQLQRNSPMKSQNSFSVKKKNHFYKSIKRAKNIKINYLKISYFISTTFLKVFLKKSKSINIKYIKVQISF